MDIIKCDIRQLEQDNQRIIEGIKAIMEQMETIKYIRDTLKDDWTGSAAQATEIRLDELLKLLCNIMYELQKMAKLECESKETYYQGENQIANMISDVIVV